MIPYGRQTIGKEEKDAVLRVLDSDWMTQGPYVSTFEKELAAYCRASYAVAVNSGTSALHIAYIAAGIGPGDEVITTSNTFVATSSMLAAVGAMPVLCDIRPDTYNIDVTKIEALITKKTKAIVPVHFAGHPCDMEEIQRIAKKHNLVVIEDACQALGGSYKGNPIGSCSHSDFVVFSFHPVKSITTAEGGAVMTNNKEAYEQMNRLRCHGITRDPALMQEQHGDWYFEMIELGYNYRLTDVHAAIGIEQIKKIDSFIDARKKQAAYYMEQLQAVEGLVLPTHRDNVLSAWHLFVVQVDQEKRKAVFDGMRKHDIWVQMHHVPVHIHPFYKQYLTDIPTLSITDEYYRRAFSVPLFPQLTKEEQDRVITHLRNLIASV